MRQLSAEEEEFQKFISIYRNSQLIEFLPKKMTLSMRITIRVPGRELSQNFAEFSMLVLQVSSTIKIIIEHSLR